MKGSSIEVPSSSLCDDDISFDGDGCLSDNDDEISLCDDDISFDGDSCLSENVNVPSDDDDKRTMPPKVFAFLRMSPRTVNDGSFQKRVIGILPVFDQRWGVSKL
jgi:hypothetical protein